MLIGVIAEELLLPEAGSGWSAAPFIDPDLFPLATIAVPGFMLLEEQFDEGDIIHATFITAGQGIFPQLFVDSDVIYAATRGAIIPVLAPDLVRDNDLFSSPTVLTNALGPSLVIDDDLFGGVKRLQQGKASINQQIPIDHVLDADRFFAPLVERAGTTLIPQQAAFSADAEVVYLSETTRSTTTLSGSFVNETAALTAPPLGYLLSPLVVAGDVFFTPDIRRPIVLGLFNDADVIYAATRFDRLAPGRVLDSEAVFPGSFGGPTLLPGIAIDADTFFVPAISIITALAAGLFSDGDIFFAPLTSIGETFDTVIDPDFVFAPSIVAGDTTTAPSLVGADDAVPAPSIVVVVTLTAGLFDEGDTFFVPSENSVGAPSIFTDTDTFFAPTVQQLGFDGALSIDGPIMPANPQPTVILVEA